MLAQASLWASAKVCDANEGGTESEIESVSIRFQLNVLCDGVGSRKETGIVLGVTVGGTSRDSTGGERGRVADSRLKSAIWGM